MLKRTWYIYNVYKRIKKLVYLFNTVALALSGLEWILSFLFSAQIERELSTSALIQIIFPPPNHFSYSKKKKKKKSRESLSWCKIFNDEKYHEISHTYKREIFSSFLRIWKITSLLYFWITNYITNTFLNTKIAEKFFNSIESENKNHFKF